MRKVYFIFTICALSLFTFFSCSTGTECGVQYPINDAVQYSFGTFEQDGIAENGREDILWRLIYQKGGKVLLVSEYVLDTVVLSDQFDSVDFYAGVLGDWLSHFYESSFSSDEKACILKENNNGIVFIPDSGLFTCDNVQSLSCSPTEYAKSNGVYYTSSDNSGEICWWFADGGAGGDTVRCAIGDSSVSSVPVTTAGIGIRPAIWVDYEMLKKHFTIMICIPDDCVFFEGDSPEDYLTGIYAVSKSYGALSIRNVCTILPETFTQPGRQYITVEYNGHTKTEEIYVYARPAEIELNTPPSKKVFTVGSNIDTDGVSFLVTMDGGEQMIIDKGYTFQPKKALTEGVSTVTITIAGKTFEYEIQVNGSDIEDLVVKNKKDFAEYGEKISPEDFDVFVKFKDGKTEQIDGGYSVTCSDSVYYTDSVVTVSYGGHNVTSEIRLMTEIVEITPEISQNLLYFGELLQEEYVCHIKYSSGYEEDRKCKLVLNENIVYDREQKFSGEYIYLSDSGSNEYSKITVPLKLQIRKLIEIRLLEIPELRKGDVFSILGCSILFVYEDGFEFNITIDNSPQCDKIRGWTTVSVSYNGRVDYGPFETEGVYTLEVSFEGCSAEGQFRVL